MKYAHNTPTTCHFSINCKIKNKKKLIKKIRKKLKLKKTKILFLFFLKKILQSTEGRIASFQHRRWARCTHVVRRTRPRLFKHGHG
jgi:hypothetical protein